MITALALVAFIIYSTARAFENANYFAEPYISPFYAPCITTACEGDTFPELFTGPAFISPTLYILLVPLGFRLTCYYYYYRKAYYGRSGCPRQPAPSPNRTAATQERPGSR